MSFIPSEELSAVLDTVKTGLWIESPANDRTALVVKMPETGIKAIYRGAGCSLLLAVIQAEPLSILCLGLRVADEPENPITIAMPISLPQDVALLREILNSAHSTLHCVNELNHPVLSASISMDAPMAHKAGNAIYASHPFLLTPTSSIPPQDFARILKRALDCFQAHIYRAPDKEVGDSVRMSAVIPLALHIWEPTEIFEVTSSDQGGPFRIDNEDEGGKLEKMVQIALDKVYPGYSYRSPAVRDGPGMRELTDVLGFDANSICVIQSKAMSVLTVATERSSRRRASTVTKQIKEALSQLRGALVNIRAGCQIFNTGGEPIVIPNQQTPLTHAVVVLSEMYAFVDWKAVAGVVADLSDDDSRRALFQVMDIQELSYLCAHSEDARAFNNLMLQRWAFVKERGTSYARGIMPPSGVESWWISGKQGDNSES